MLRSLTRFKSRLLKFFYSNENFSLLVYSFMKYRIKFLPGPIVEEILADNQYAIVGTSYTTFNASDNAVTRSNIKLIILYFKATINKVVC